MTNKKFKLAAMSLATAVAVSAVGPSASAVTYYLGDGSVTVGQDKDGKGAYSYQGEDQGDKNRTYVNVEQEKTGDGTIYVMDGNAPTGEVTPPTDNSDNGTEETTPAEMPHNPPMLLATTKRTTPRLRPQPQTPSRSKRM